MTPSGARRSLRAVQSPAPGGRHVPIVSGGPPGGQDHPRFLRGSSTPQVPISSVAKRFTPVDRGTHQRLRLMNLNANKPTNLYKDGSWGVERECNSYPKGCAFRATANVCVMSDSSFSWERLFFCCYSGSFPWQLLLPHIWHLYEMAPKAQGSTRRPPHPVYPAKDMEKHWVEHALALGLVDEASSAVAEFLGVLRGSSRS